MRAPIGRARGSNNIPARHLQSAAARCRAERSILSAPAKTKIPARVIAKIMNCKLSPVQQDRYAAGKIIMVGVASTSPLILAEESDFTAAATRKLSPGANEG